MVIKHESLCVNWFACSENFGDSVKPATQFRRNPEGSGKPQ
jgi:hypothetical protein